jgi:hypothetical protein
MDLAGLEVLGLEQVQEVGAAQHGVALGAAQSRDLRGNERRMGPCRDEASNRDRYAVFL